jgi:hypothetical protein
VGGVAAWDPGPATRIADHRDSRLPPANLVHPPFLCRAITTWITRPRGIDHARHPHPPTSPPSTRLSPPCAPLSKRTDGAGAGPDSSAHDANRRFRDRVPHVARRRGRGPSPSPQGAGTSAGVTAADARATGLISRGGSHGVEAHRRFHASTVSGEPLTGEPTGATVKRRTPCRGAAGGAALVGRRADSETIYAGAWPSMSIDVAVAVDTNHRLPAAQPWPCHAPNRARCPDRGYRPATSPSPGTVKTSEVRPVRHDLGGRTRPMSRSTGSTSRASRQQVGPGWNIVLRGPTTRTRP